MAVLPPGLVQALGPVLEQIADMTVKIKAYDRAIKRLTETEYPETQPLIKVYGVGQLTALTYILTLGSKERFPAKPGCGLLLGTATTKKPVRRSRPSARHHQGGQRLSPLPARRVRQPCARASRRILAYDNGA